MTGALWPAQYEIRVDGHLDAHWSEWFDGLQVEDTGNETTITGVLPDQSALYGVLDKIRDLGLSVLAVRRITSDDGPGQP